MFGLEKLTAKAAEEAALKQRAAIETVERKEANFVDLKAKAEAAATKEELTEVASGVGEIVSALCGALQGVASALTEYAATNSKLLETLAAATERAEVLGDADTTAEADIDPIEELENTASEDGPLSLGAQKELMAEYKEMGDLEQRLNFVKKFLTPGKDGKAKITRAALGK